MGRKSVDEIIESNLTQVISMLKDGCKDKEIIEFLGISRSAWKAKKNSNSKLKQAIDEGYDINNENIQNTIYTKLNSYSKNCLNENGFNYPCIFNVRVNKNRFDYPNQTYN